MGFADDFMKGQIDCQQGIPAREDMSAEYYRGYGSQYELEQVKTALNLKQEKQHGY